MKKSIFITLIFAGFLANAQTPTGSNGTAGIQTAPSTPTGFSNSDFSNSLGTGTTNTDSSSIGTPSLNTNTNVQGNSPMTPYGVDNGSGNQGLIGSPATPSNPATPSMGNSNGGQAAPANSNF